jgi:AcrR family transcriptional regulator
MAAKRRATRPADLRKAVLEASLALIEEGGIEALSLREVARRMHVTHGAPYHHFPDRAAILAALAEEGFALLADAMRAEMADEAPGSLERFEAAGRAYVSFALEHTAHMKLMCRSELGRALEHPRVCARAGEAMQLLVDCVEECRSTGAIVHDDPAALVLTSWACAHGIAALLIDGPLPGLRAGEHPLDLGHSVINALSSLLELSSRKRRPRRTRRR